MHEHEREEAKNLSRCRRGLWSNGHFRYDLTPEQRARRVDEYARQVERHGEIVAYLPTEPEPNDPPYRSKFDRHGDILNPRR